MKHIRLQHNLFKYKVKDQRVYEKLPELGYGEEAQVDFGQAYMQTDKNYQVKVYFFAILLSRSRQKFIYFQKKPFTTVTAVYAYEYLWKFNREQIASK